jgi:hypothetical protein
LAPELLKNYRSPNGGWGIEALTSRYGPEHLGWDAKAGDIPPVIFAGIEVNNSETGNGQTEVLPRFEVRACMNGLKVDLTHSFRRIHLGGRMDQGVVKWSEDTQRKRLDLITAEIRDSVQHMLSPEYLAEGIASLHERAEKPVKDAVKAVELVTRRFGFTQDEQATILAHFIQGAQATAGGIMQAITSTAVVTTDPDRAFQLEAKAVEAMELVA